MQLTPDSVILWQAGPLVLNATILYTWLVMALLVLASWAVTRNLSSGPEPSHWQTVLETVVVFVTDQIRDITGRDSRPFLPFVGTLFLFISISNLLAPVPVYEAPTGSLSTTAALAICVFFAVPIYGVTQQGLVTYLRHYVQPSPIMLPFHIIGEMSRTVALAVRLFGNVMSGSMIAAILLSIVPLFLPVILQVLELVIGQIQAYIFAVLATVYIASAMRSPEEQRESARNQ
jgi:F-type H+-transporting ATPase subunit a